MFHEKILAALKREDPKAVHSLMKAHIVEAAEFVTKTESEFGLGLIS